MCFSENIVIGNESEEDWLPNDLVGRLDDSDVCCGKHGCKYKSQNSFRQLWRRDFLFPRLSLHMNLKQRGSGSFSFRNCNPWFNDPCWFCGLSTCVCPVRHCQVKSTTSPPSTFQSDLRPSMHLCVWNQRWQKNMSRSTPSFYLFYGCWYRLLRTTKNKQRRRGAAKPGGWGRGIPTGGCSLGPR